MATRFYLPSSGSSPLPSLADSSVWDEVASSFFRAPLVTSKTDTALADFAGRFGSGATGEMIHGQWVSAALAEGYNFTTASDTISAVVRGVEADPTVDGYLQIVARVVSGDGNTVRGTLMSYAASPELATSAQTRIISARALDANVNASAGDRIVVELGSWGFTPYTAADVTWRYGDPSATNDFALTSGLTTDLCPWVELSATLSFGAAAASGYMTPARGIW